MEGSRGFNKPMNSFWLMFQIHVFDLMAFKMLTLDFSLSWPCQPPHPTPFTPYSHQSPFYETASSPRWKKICKYMKVGYRHPHICSSSFCAVGFGKRERNMHPSLSPVGCCFPDLTDSLFGGLYQLGGLVFWGFFFSFSFFFRFGLWRTGKVNSESCEDDGSPCSSGARNACLHSLWAHGIYTAPIL